MLYLASPFFNPKENAVLDVVELLLEQNNLIYFSPRKAPGNESGIPKEEKLKKAKEIFDKDIEQMNKSDILFAATDGYPFSHEGKNGIARDAGTAFELGYFFHKNVHRGQSNIITFSANGFGSNLMIAQCSSLHLNNLAEVKKFLDFVGLQKEENQGYYYWRDAINEYKKEHISTGMVADVEKP